MLRQARNKRPYNNFNSNKKSLRRFETFVEIVIHTLAYFLMWIWCYRVQMHPYLGLGKYMLVGVYLILTGLILQTNDACEFGHRKRKELAAAQAISMFFVNLITYFQLCLMATRMLPVLPMIALFIVQIAISFGLVWLYHMIYRKCNTPHNMLLIYSGDSGPELREKMNQRKDKYRITTIINAAEGKEKIREEIRRHDSVILNDVPAEVRNDILKSCYQRGIRTYTVPKISDIIDRGAEEITLFDTPLLLLNTQGLSAMQRVLKRIGDVLLSVIALCISSPFWAVIAIAIKKEDGGPVFYKQQRVTINGRKFMVLKFRSMVPDAEKGGNYEMSMRAQDEDPRITKVGRIIRKCRLDELPQIWNILRGDMSIVGPRPERTEHVTEYSKEIPEFNFRHKVKAGLTGYAQVYGKYNTSAYDKLRLDLMYITKYSIVLDIKLIFMTLQILIKPEATEGFVAEEQKTQAEEGINGLSAQERVS